MGYSTEFSGQLTFTCPMDGEKLGYLNQFLDAENPDDHADWIKPDSRYGYIDFELTKDFTGIKWNGAEKTYYAVESINIILANMQAKYPDFGLSGVLLAQGEDVEDRWELAIVDGKAVHRDAPHTGMKVTCPHCDEIFFLGDKS